MFDVVPVVDEQFVGQYKDELQFPNHGYPSKEKKEKRCHANLLGTCQRNAEREHENLFLKLFKAHSLSLVNFISFKWIEGGAQKDKRFCFLLFLN